MLTEQSDTRVNQALAKYDFYFLPVFNIDGYKYTFQSRVTRFWRKTRKDIYWYCKGVDPNRNWDSHWNSGKISLCVSMKIGSCIEELQIYIL